MIHISIEGHDGVGKSTLCQLLAKKLGYKFVEKPLHYLFDENESDFENYIRIRDQVNANPNRNFSSLFYGLGSVYMYEMFKDENIITDRHLASNFAWSGNDNNKDIFRLLINKIGVPKLTVIVYATEDVIEKRLKLRDPLDPDLKRVKKSKEIYEKMISFCKEFKLPYILIDTSNLTPEQTLEIVLKELQK